MLLGQHEAIAPSVLQLGGEDISHPNTLVPVISSTGSRIQVSRVDGVKDCAVNLVESIAGILSQLLNLQVVVWVSIIAIAIGPEPELRVGVKAPANSRHRVQGLHEVTDILHLNL